MQEYQHTMTEDRDSSRENRASDTIAVVLFMAVVIGVLVLLAIFPEWLY